MTAQRYVYKHPRGWVNLADGQVLEQGGGDPPPDTGIAIGASYSSKAGVDNRIYAGRSKSSRIFFTNTNLSGVNMAAKDTLQEALADGADTFIISAKDPDPNRWNTFIKTKPAGIKKLYTCYYHEPIDDLTANVWKNNWANVAPAMTAAGGIPTSILQGWVLFGANLNSDDWVPDIDLVPVQAFDGYFDKYEPNDFFNRMANHCTKNGILRTGIGETGAPPTYAQRLSRMQTYVNRRDGFKAATGVDLEFATFWNDYDQNGSGTITWDGRMLKLSYYGGNPQTKRQPTSADWDTALADIWFGG